MPAEAITQENDLIRRAQQLAAERGIPLADALFELAGIGPGTGPAGGDTASAIPAMTDPGPAGGVTASAIPAMTDPGPARGVTASAIPAMTDPGPAGLHDMVSRGRDLKVSMRREELRKQGMGLFEAIRQAESEIPQGDTPARSDSLGAAGPARGVTASARHDMTDPRAREVTIPPYARLASANNNPGNLRYAGQPGAVLGEGGFAKFQSPYEGYNAVTNQVNLDTSRGMSLGEFLTKYAPPTENDTATYIQNISSEIGGSPDDALTDFDPDVLAQALSKFESGTTVSTAPIDVLELDRGQPAEDGVDVEPVNEIPESAVEDILVAGGETEPSVKISPVEEGSDFVPGFVPDIDPNRGIGQGRFGTDLEQEFPLPEQTGGQRGLRLLELLGGIGAKFADSRAIGRSNRENAARQARANLIGALRGGRGGGKAFQEQPKRGILGHLAALAGGVGSGLREARAADVAGDKEDFANKIARDKVGLDRISAQAAADRAEAALSRENRMTGTANSKVVGSKLFERNESGDWILVADGAKKGAPKTVTTADGATLIWDEDKGKYVELAPAGAIDTTDEGKDTGLQRRFKEAGRLHGSDLDAVWRENPDLKDFYDRLGKLGRLRLEGAIMEGDREAREASGGAGSASERLQIADARTMLKQFTAIEDQWKEAGMKGYPFAIMSIFTGFDTEEDFGATAMRRLFDDSANLNDSLKFFGLAIARVLNGGRPSEKDEQAASRMLPKQSDGDALANKKFKQMRKFIQLRIDAIERGVTDSQGLPISFTGDAEEWLLHNLGEGGSEHSEANTENAEDGTVQIPDDLGEGGSE